MVSRGQLTASIDRRRWRKKTTGICLVLSDQQVASVPSGVVIVSEGAGLTHGQVESQGEEAEQDAGQQPQQGEV